MQNKPAPHQVSRTFAVGNGHLHVGDALEVLPQLPAENFQMILADPPYFQVLLKEKWDVAWDSPEAYLDWTSRWVQECQRVLRPDGLLFIFGQLGKREHVWLHVCSRLAHLMQFHDMIIWDRAVGYNERSDSFTPQYEMILVLRHPDCTLPFFNKDAVRLPYDEQTIQTYLKDTRYKNKAARMEHLQKGKYATNILRVPSLKGMSKEKVGHPSQKPLALINMLVAAASRPGDEILDPFFGSGTTGLSAQDMGRAWVGIEVDEKYAEMARERLSILI